jgi:hypothetical protein
MIASMETSQFLFGNLDATSREGVSRFWRSGSGAKCLIIYRPLAALLSVRKSGKE